jgi:hypothetical protein
MFIDTENPDAKMKAARIVAIVMLVFLGLSGIVGAIPMLMQPHDEPWHMPQSLLQYSPFHSYLIPGIILLAANGLLSLWALAHRDNASGLRLVGNNARVRFVVVANC